VFIFFYLGPIIGVFLVDHFLTIRVKIVDLLLDFLKGDILLIFAFADELIQVSLVTVVLNAFSFDLVLKAAELLIEDLLATALG